MSTSISPAETRTTPRISSSADRKGNVLVRWITSTDHKVIGYMYLITSFVYFCIGGVMALVMRAQLFAPGLEIVQTKEQYNQLFTMHGTISMIVPCMVNSWLYCSLVWTISRPGANSWARMTRAMTPPMQKYTNDVIRYMYPMTLWSVEVIHRTRTLPLRSADDEIRGVVRVSAGEMLVLMA